MRSGRLNRDALPGRLSYNTEPEVGNSFLEFFDEQDQGDSVGEIRVIA